MDYLFSYGTLRDSSVQQAVFGRPLQGRPDELPGFKLSAKKAYGSYPLVVKTPDALHSVSGVVYTLNPDDLEKADAYEGPEYKRIQVDLKSGKKVWLYVASNT